MAESKTLVSCPTCRLPAEVWQQIASFMTLREWARVSGTCESMWRVPLLEVKVTCEEEWEHPAAGALHWAAQRSSQTRVLVYDVYHTSADGNFDNFVASIEGATQALSQLCKHARLVQDILIYNNSPYEEDLVPIGEMASAVTAQLAASALQPQTLKCQFGKLASFPCIPTLKHLIIEVHYMTFQDGLGALNALQNLETLQIAVAPAAGYEWRFSEHIDCFDCPVLDLTSLRRLRNFSLGFTPEGILVCPGCAVHVAMYCPVGHQVWANLSGLHSEGSLRSIHWSNSDYNSLLKPPDAIPRVIRENWQLQSVSIDSDKWELGGLSDALAAVRVLRISGIEVAFRVPASVSWQQFSVVSGITPVIHFEDVLAFARLPLGFRFACYHTWGTDPRGFGQEWAPFNNAMALNKPGWVCMSPQLEKKTCKLISYGTFAHDCIFAHDCVCGACLKCLRGKGEVHAL